jgi:prepilin-type N-terminal cleavage/methylation domain-containing protein
MTRLSDPNTSQAAMKGHTTVKTTGLQITRKRRRASARRGFSIIELLVAIIIIGVLVAVLIPVVSSRTEQARVARVNADLQAMADAMERVENDTGYLVRLFALNDVLQGDGVGYKRDPRVAPVDRADGITDYRQTVTQPYLQFDGSTNGLFIDPRTSDYALNTTRNDVIDRFIANESSYDGSLAWNGPYVNWQKDRNLYSGDTTPLRDGIPDDPWGNNYLLFLPTKSVSGSTQGGLVLEPSGLIVATTVRQTGNQFFQGGGFATDVFDRPTIVSIGPNGVPGNGAGGTGEGTFGGGDDFVRTFGR